MTTINQTLQLNSSINFIELKLGRLKDI